MVDMIDMVDKLDMVDKVDMQALARPQAYPG